MKKALLAILCWFVLVPIASAEEAGFSYSAGVDLNYKKLDFEFSSGGPPVRYKPDLWMLGISPSVAYGKFFLTVGLERSLSDGTTTDIQNTSTVTAPNLIDARVNRQENSVTLGYNVWAGLSVFAGYMKNSTDVTANWTNVGNGSQLFEKTQYTERGPYGGLGYTHRFENHSLLSGSFAYLKGRGHIADQDVFIAPNFNNQGNADGDVKGQSYSVTWSAPLTGSLYYRLGVKVTRYDFTYRFGPSNIAPETTTKQNYDAFTIGLVNYF
jgi:hypothetical protein